MMTFTAYQVIVPGTGYGIAVMANTGTLHRDAQAIGARLVDLMEGRTSARPATPLVWIDLTTLVLVLGAVLLGLQAAYLYSMLTVLLAVTSGAGIAVMVSRAAGAPAFQAILRR